MDKVCKDCKHCLPDADHLWTSAPENKFKYAKCLATIKDGHSASPTCDPVTGIPHKEEDKHYYCSVHRSAGHIQALIEGLCGLKGRFFEPKEEHD